MSEQAGDTQEIGGALEWRFVRSAACFLERVARCGRQRRADPCDWTEDRVKPGVGKDRGSSPVRMTKNRPASPYLAPGFYDRELARGRHRDIVGGRWDETGNLQLALLREVGLEPYHTLLDVGAGALRLGCKVVPFLEPGRYWATDPSLALMRRGYDVELAHKDRLPEDHLIEDATFDFPGVPGDVDYAIAFAVFTHLPLAALEHALPRMRATFPRLRKLLFTVFHAPEGTPRLRQPDGVVTHAERPPWHFAPEAVAKVCEAAGFDAAPSEHRLPRGQVLWTAEIRPKPGAV